MKRGRWYGLVCGLTSLVFLVSAQAQEKYPNRAIELVIPYSPGGSHDLAARTYSDKLGQVLKVPITAVNRAGGAGVQGAIYVARAKKDGYTLFAGGQGPVVVGPLISVEATYDPLKDLFPLGYFGSTPSVFVVRTDSPIKSFGELVEYARKNPEKLTNAAGGLTTSSQFNLEILCARNNLKITTIPFKGGGEATVALLGGHVDMTSSGVLTLGPQIKVGKFRALAITSKKRFPDFPDIPTTAELGYPYLNFVLWVGVFAPAGLPQPILDVLVPTVAKVLKDPEVADRASAINLMVDYMGPEEFRKFLESEIRIVEKIVQDAGLKGK